ncbi:hypothetical protein PIB30_059930 [Stylosanthes scabra]|uniref:Uncharacterized protein n=1 Tax=Stylosanthes scabra TaxID=79078 RepID=A0ABU6VMU5_9FABA|nr:hypothetical protein [Stylosanthes scabra]
MEMVTRYHTDETRREAKQESSNTKRNRKKAAKKKLAGEGEKSVRLRKGEIVKMKTKEAFMIRHHDETTFGASLTAHEARNVGNVGLPEFGATVPDIGPGRPKSPNDTHIEPFIR